MAQGAPGLVGLLGSGETAAAGGRLFDALASTLPTPLSVAVLETPAGFELNSDRVAGRVADFLRTRLSNYQPQVTVIPARRRGTPFSPDEPDVSAPLLYAGLIFAGPGSPTYAAKQLRGSLAWDRLQARIGLGAAAVFASAAAIAVGRYALPVYEIYKAGHDLHWQEGLDLFGPFGLSLVIVPHWNNNDGGAELDTSRCFMGEARFSQLRSLLPEDVCVVGLDEHTGLVMDLGRGEGKVLGQGCVTVLHGGEMLCFRDGDRIALKKLGPFKPADLLAAVPLQVRDEALATGNETSPVIPDYVLALAEQRQAARVRHDWASADRLRNKIEELGWQVQDTAAGPKVLPGNGHG